MLQIVKISVKVKTNSKKEGVTKIDAGNFEVRVRSFPLEGKANRAVIKMLAEYFTIPKSRIRILRGERSKLKIVGIG